MSDRSIIISAACPPFDCITSNPIQPLWVFVEGVVAHFVCDKDKYDNEAGKTDREAQHTDQRVHFVAK